jgi:hypothetical protein
MLQRGRKSRNNLDTNGVATLPVRLEPPSHLTAKEQALFAQVIASAPSGQFSPSDVFLLTTFVQITALIEGAATAARKASDQTRQTKFKMLAELAKTQSLIGTKLRLTPSSRIGPKTVGRAADVHRPSAYDIGRMSGSWDFG